MSTQHVKLKKRTDVDFSRWAVHPALIFTLVFFALPLAIMVVVSFWQRIYGKLSATWSLANYEKFIGKDYLLDALYNSIEVTLLTTAISILLAYPLAYILAYRVPLRWQRFVLILTVLPFWTAYVVRSYSWLLIISENGIINTVLIGIGVIDQPLEMAYSRGATVLGFVHFFTMLLTLTIYANLVQIKESYRKAAADLGASPLQVFMRITLPLSIPGVAVGAFITFVICIGDYITPQILGGGTEVLVPQAIMLQIARAANFPMASVMSIMLMIVVVIVYFISAKHLKMERV
ncbi:MAG: ABC transporter permease [Rhodospirillales bacterium]|nr:ABC transporter permease [Rhodospirillales bacterium]